MKSLLADANIEGYIDLLVAMMQGEAWRFFWDLLQMRYVRFLEIGLAPDSPDNLVWQTCQNQNLFLITDNRNKIDPDSLEETIRRYNKSTSLPVFTIADVQRLRHSRDYANKVIEALFEYLLQEDNILGTGRLYLP